LRMGHGTTVEHHDDAVGRRPVDRKRNAHHEDVRVGLANASTQCRGRRGGVRDKEYERRWTFICVSRCSVNENVSRRRAAHCTLPTVVCTSDRPCIRQPTRSKTRNRIPYGP
jgi:hypothetical protein